MPNSTFFKLDEFKQNKILKAAIQVFSQETYKEVKISKLTKAADIPRSSFYDYFDNKMDLYQYILDYMGQIKQDYYRPIQEGQLSFFDQLRQMIISSAKFMADQPELNQIAKRFLSDPKLIKEIYGQESLDVTAALENMIRQGIENGDIKADIPIAFTAKTINILSSELMLQGLQENEALEDVLNEIGDQMIDFIKYGIAKDPN